MTAFVPSLTSQFAAFFKVSTGAIKKIQRWSNVWFVVIAGKGARFVSLNAIIKPSSAKEVALAIKKALKIKSRLKKTQTANWLLKEVYRLASYKGEIFPYSFREIAYGITYSIRTARIDGEMAIALERHFDASSMATLVAAIAVSGVTVSGDVPAWLNKNRDVIVS
jgi:hypothetical protein